MIPLPSISGVLGIGLAASLIGIGIQTLRLDHAKTETAETKLEFANFKTSIAEQNLRLTKEQQARESAAFDKLTQALSTLGALGQKTVTEVKLVQSNNGPCNQDPAYLAMLDGVERVRLASAQRGAGRDAAKGQPGPPTALQPARASIKR